MESLIFTSNNPVFLRRTLQSSKPQASLVPWKLAKHVSSYSSPNNTTYVVLENTKIIKTLPVLET
ncbi:hypothetical protein [Metallosphaera javensis (ex Hofmann et al. 2022)]|uniref:hypothetical protein n=1 Tax=Metallosphaera javensis (ex Hofmann et al. 2022) TaxID=99938 RepID=UPI001EDE8220|nr:hypothetical protein [Metallosphaera javensis (ex Hofmann et al. 2022)]